MKNKSERQNWKRRGGHSGAPPNQPASPASPAADQGTSDSRNFSNGRPGGAKDNICVAKQKKKKRSQNWILVFLSKTMTKN